MLESMKINWKIYNKYKKIYIYKYINICIKYRKKNIYIYWIKNILNIFSNWFSSILGAFWDPSWKHVGPMLTTKPRKRYQTRRQKTLHKDGASGKQANPPWPQGRISKQAKTLLDIQNTIEILKNYKRKVMLESMKIN